MADAILISDIKKSFGGKAALKGVSFDVRSGELLAIIGPNGSGKTTLLNILTGHLAPDAGRVMLHGRRIDGRPPEAIARLGMIRMFQLTRLFQELSVMDNLLTVGLAVGLGRPKAEERGTWLLDKLGLTRFAHAGSGALSGGQKKLLEFAMCFMADSRVVLLDEPFSAIAAAAKEIMLHFIRERNGEGDTIVVVSHDMPVVASLCPRTVCMADGAVLADGPTARVLSDDEVVESVSREPGRMTPISGAGRHHCRIFGRRRHPEQPLAVRRRHGSDRYHRAEWSRQVHRHEGHHGVSEAARRQDTP